MFLRGPKLVVDEQLFYDCIFFFFLGGVNYKKASKPSVNFKVVS